MFSCCRGQQREEIGFGFSTIRVLGKGAGGKVFLCHTQDLARKSELAAVKTIDLGGAPAWQLDMLQRECEALACQSHPNLVRPHEVRLTASNVQLVLQHCAGGTLENYCKHHRVTEDTACYFMHQLVRVLEHLHTSSIAYRDMKLQNVLLASKPIPTQPPRLVLCDLGTAKCFKGPPARCETFVGTPGFMSPQVLASMFNNSSHRNSISLPSPDEDSSHHSSHLSSTSKSSHTYDARKADIWALGALLHYMLHRQLPYGYDSFAPLLPPAEALMTLYQLEHRHTWKDAAGAHGLKPISAEAQDLLDQLLHPDESQRISIRRIKLHPWYNRPLPGHYTKALQAMQLEQQQSQQSGAGTADSSTREQCRQLAVEAVDKLFELSRSPAVLQRLRQQQRCLSVPLSCCRLQAQCSSSCSNTVVQQLAQVVQELDAEAAGCKSRLSASSSSSAPAHQQQPPPSSAVAGTSCKVGAGRTRDDTCYLLQVKTC